MVDAAAGASADRATEVSFTGPGRPLKENVGPKVKKYFLLNK
jgi:hypothetical protein